MISLDPYTAAFVCLLVVALVVNHWVFLVLGVFIFLELLING